MDKDKTEESIEDILERLREIEHEHEILEILNGLVRGDRDKGTPGLKSIVYGSEALGVKPLRDELRELNEKMDRILLFEGRVKWVASLFGVSSIISLATFILVMRQLLGI